MTAHVTRSSAADEASLTPGAIHSQRIEPGQNHTYPVHLRAGDYLAVEILERGVDLEVSVLDRSGTVLDEQRTYESNQDQARVRLIARDSAEYRLQVTPRSAPGGEYQLEVGAIRQATDQDVNETAAQQAWQRAVESAQRGTPEGKRLAIDEYSAAAEHYRANADLHSEARAQLRIGRLHFMLGDRDEAITRTTAALQLHRRVGDAPGEAAAANNLGAIYQEMAEPTRAIEYFTQALPVLRANKDAYREASVTHNLAYYHHLLGEFSAAATYYQRALSLWGAAGSSNGQAQTLNNLGFLSLSLGDSDRACDHFKSALALRRAINDDAGQAETLGNLGFLHEALNDREMAHGLFQKSLAAAIKAGAVTSEILALIGLAITDEDPGSAAAGRYLDSAIAKARAIGDRRVEARALTRLADWHHARGEPATAATTYRKALELQRAAADTSNMAWTLLGLARLQRDTGDLRRSHDSVAQAISMVESLRGQVAQPDLRDFHFASVQDFYETLIDVLMRLHEREPQARHDIQALQVSERARARGLLDALAERSDDLLRKVDARLLERERQARRLLNARDRRWQVLLAEASDKATLTAARRAVDEAVDELNELQGEIRSRSRRYAELTQVQSHSLDLPALQRQLGSSSVVLEYWLGSERSYVWAVTRDSVTSHALPAAPEIEALTRQYVAVLTRRPPARASDRLVAEAPLQTLGAELTRKLLAPLARELLGKRLILVRHGALEYLPFAALPAARSNASGQARPLIDEHEIVYLPSIAVLAALREHATQGPRPAKTLAVFADPVFTADDPRVIRASSVNAPPRAAAIADAPEDLHRSSTESGLPSLRRLRFSRLEARAIAALVPESQRFEAIGFRANRTTALDGALSQYRILHFATHGLMNSVHPELSGVVLSAVDERGALQDGLLRLHEIFGLSLRADLVVLSACQTGLGREIKGEGLIGLTRGFMYAGSPRVIATLWNVDDHASAELMKRFYQVVLARKVAPAAALREAQIALRQEQRWSSPYYWAGFILSGDWN